MEKELTENDIKKIYLLRYQKHKAAVNRIDAEIAEIRELKQSVRAVVNDGMPHGHVASDLSSYAAVLDEKKREKSKERYLRIKCYIEIEERIKMLEEEDEINVLTYRYIKGYGWSKISEMLNYSERWVHKLHGKALKKFKLPKEFIEIHIEM